MLPLFRRREIPLTPHGVDRILKVQFSPGGGKVTHPARQDDVGVSVLAGTRTDLFALALDGFFNTVQLAGLLTGERDGTGGRQQLLRLLRELVEGGGGGNFKESAQRDG